MRWMFVVVAGLFVLPGAVEVDAQEVLLVSQNRSIYAEASASADDRTDADSSGISAPDFGFFDATVSADASAGSNASGSGFALAQQTSTAEGMTIEGSGTVTAEASGSWGGGYYLGSGEGLAESIFAVTFTVESPVAFELTATLDVGLEPGEALSEVTLSGPEGDVINEGVLCFIYGGGYDCGETAVVSELGILVPGQYTLVVRAYCDIDQCCGSFTEAEAGFEVSLCFTTPGCVADTNEDGQVDVDDLVNVILDWGGDGSRNGGDVDGTGLVDADDLMLVILLWGPCE